MAFIIVAGICLCLYFLFLCFMVFQVFRNISGKQSSLPAMSKVRRLHYEVRHLGTRYPASPSFAVCIRTCAHACSRVVGNLFFQLHIQSIRQYLAPLLEEQASSPLGSPSLSESLVLSVACGRHFRSNARTLVEDLSSSGAGRGVIIMYATSMNLNCVTLSKRERERKKLCRSVKDRLWQENQFYENPKKYLEPQKRINLLGRLFGFEMECGFLQEGRFAG